MCKRTKGYKYLFLGIALHFLFLSQIYASDKITIHTIEGNTYPQVSAEKHYDSKILTFQYDNKIISLSFINIDKILNSDGNDITEEYLGYEESIKKGVWQDRQGSTRNKYKHKPYSISVSVSPNLGIPVGSYYEGINSGLGFYLGFSVALTDRIDLRIAYCNTGMNLSKEYEPLEFSATKLQFNLYYHSFMYQLESGLTNFYGYAGLGTVLNKGKIDNIDFDYTENNFSLNSGAGMVVMLGKNIGLDFGFAIDIQFLPKQDEDDEYVPYYDIYNTGSVATAMTFDLRAGLAFYL